ncbi:MAG: PEP-CTERM sorting domain-containing protein, partial [Thermoguttaceae bacterium]|nr:PEP-CTERM sorting domain-containing protein [Thermoguttaceae bacterium]
RRRISSRVSVNSTHARWAALRISAGDIPFSLLIYLTSSFVIDSNSIIDIVADSLQPGAEYPIIINSSPDGFEGDLATDDFWNGLLTPGSDYYWNLSVRGGNTVYASVDANAVPEPSTWALLILGVVGIMYWRKRKN